jgi:hypothetical protein
MDCPIIPEDTNNKVARKKKENTKGYKSKGLIKREKSKIFLGRMCCKYTLSEKKMW